MPEREVLALLLAVVIATLAYTSMNFRRERIIAALCVIAYLSMSYICVCYMPATNAWHDEQSFVRRVIARLGASNSHLGLFLPFGGLGPLFYMAPPHPLPAFDRASQLDAAVADGRIRWVIVRRKDVPEMRIGGTIVDAQQLFPFEQPPEQRHKVILMHVGPQPEEPSEQLTSVASSK